MNKTANPTTHKKYMTPPVAFGSAVDVGAADKVEPQLIEKQKMVLN